MQANRLVNGVFEGGGAKSIAYAGALRAVAERGVWFGSVAGSSAGAIAASLIAAGLEIDDFEAAIPAGLAAADAPIAGRLGLAIVGRATSVFDAEPLRRWLDDTYATAIGHDRECGPVTFEALYAATGIELYVISFDLATALPVVFSRRSTPTVDVAGAVAASSAIPSAFQAGRLAVTDPAGAMTVHQLIDGASWANYPSFVFDDRAFRVWLSGEARHDRTWTDADEASWRAESERPVLGFVFASSEPAAGSDDEHVDDPATFVPLDAPTIDPRFDLGPAGTSSSRLMHLVGSTLSSDAARFAIGLALVVWTSISIATLPVGFRRYATWLAGWMPDPLFPITLVASLAVAVLAVLVSITLIAALIIVGRLLGDTLLPAIRSVLGVIIDTAPWIGLGDDSVVLRVPRQGLSTIGFDVDEATRRRATDSAYQGIVEQLDGDPGRRLDALLGGASAAPVVHDPSRPADPRSDGSDARSVGDRVPEPTAWLPTAILLTLAASGGLLAWWAATSAASAGIVQIIGLLIGAVVTVIVAARYGGDLARRRTHRRASVGIRHDRLPRPTVTPTVLVAAGAVLLVGAVALSTWAMNDRSDETVVAEVIEARSIDGEPGDEANDYLLRTVDGGDDIPIRSERHLRLGERVFVSFDGEGASLAGALDDIRFGVAVAAAAVGLGLVVAGERTRRWRRRNRHLAALAATMAAGRAATTGAPDPRDTRRTGQP